MPLINIKTSLPESEQTDELLKAISSKLAQLTGKPEKYVMAAIQTNVTMTFGGEKDDSCYVEVKSIGALNPPQMSFELCKCINETLGLSKDRIYINFEDIESSNWGYNGTTFG